MVNQLHFILLNKVYLDHQFNKTLLFQKLVLMIMILVAKHVIYPPRSINLCRTRPFGMHRITVVLHRAINDRIRLDTEISDHMTAVRNRLRHGEIRP